LTTRLEDVVSQRTPANRRKLLKLVGVLSGHLKNQIHSVLLQIRRHGRPAAMKRLRASDPEPRPRGRDGSEGTVR